jgi:plasmid stabilization system protein ParE
MRLRYTPRALSDLTSIFQYIDERSPIGARNVKRAI